jgi:hypothetical protein
MLTAVMDFGDTIFSPVPLLAYEMGAEGRK